MKRIILSAMGVLSVFFIGWSDLLTAQDKYDLKAPNGISFSEVRGYENWPFIAPSYRTDNDELRVILGNARMIDSYKVGVPGNGKPFAEGSTIVKIGWSERKSPVFPAAHEPDVLKRVEFIMKDTARFPATSGWGYARFVYDAKTGAYTPYGKDESFARECYQCHTLVKGKDFIFTGYPQR
ncbi:MAG: cytochrome P460 family protein [Deltaproteobacteria bacterium]|nr:cytochrome P460 family protein [Deltaproteobacteria bacterium]